MNRMRLTGNKDGSLYELDEDDDLDPEAAQENAAADLVAYDPNFAKPYFAMSIQEKKAWRRGNRKLFVGVGYGLTTVGGGIFLGGVEVLKGAALMTTAMHIVGYEIISTAIFLLVAGLTALLMLLPWEDA